MSPDNIIIAVVGCSTAALLAGTAARYPFALRELAAILADAWRAADLRNRLAAWWWVVTHQELLGEEVGDGN